MIKTFQKKTWHLCLLMMTFMIVSAQLSAQVNVSGVISSASDKEPLPGATVYEKGTTNGIATDLDGKYQLSVSSQDAIIVCSYIGFLDFETSVNGRSIVDISLKEDMMDMDEVIVTAYSQKSKTEISSSVVSLNADEINQVTVNNVEDMLVGKVAGVQVQSASGQPGGASDIRIRGVGSVFSPQEPLIVVDGIIGGSYNPNDIESVSVLKDAGATGLYGSAAAAGVILIKTKSGKAGKSEIRAKVTTGIKTPEFGNYEMMNSAQLYDYHKSLYSPSLFDTARPESLLDTDYDWVNNTYQQATITNANISASGATDKLNYYLSLDYMDDEGTLRGTDYQRFSIRSNVKYQLNDRLNLGSNITINRTESSYANWNLSEDVFRLHPWDSPYDADGNLVYDVKEAGWLSNVVSNPYHSEQYNTLGDWGIDVNASFTLDLRLYDWLKFNSMSTLGMGYGKSEIIYSPLSYEGYTDGGRMSNNVYLNQSASNTSLFKFNYRIGEHAFDGLAGTEISRMKNELDLGGEATGFLPGQTVLGVAGTQVAPSGTIVEAASVSILSQINYNYSGKYFGTVSYRRDGDSRFAPNNRYASFFTYAASWLVSSEDFMEQVSQVNYLKLRASYGAVGNSSFPDNSYYPYYPALNPGSGGYNGQTSYFPYEPGNYNLTWETSNPLNVGVDIGFFNRIEVNVDMYSTKTKDLLFRNPLPSSQGYESLWANVGQIKNSGIEGAVNATIVKTKDIRWNVNFNISANSNEMLALSDKTSVKETVITRGDPTQILTVGGGAFDWYMPKWLGVDPANGQPLWEDIIYDDNGNEIDRVATSDYTAAEEDYQITGSPFPDFTGGFGTSLAYKAFSLNASFSYSYGNEIYNTNRQEIDNDGENVATNSMVLQEGWSRWENPGDIATHPEAIYGGNMNSNKYSSRYLEDGSYIRLRNVTLAYDLPEAYAKKVKLNDVRLTFSADNLITWTNYSGADPDVALYLSNYNLPGAQSFKYPISKQFLLGLEISF